MKAFRIAVCAAAFMAAAATPRVDAADLACGANHYILGDIVRCVDAGTNYNVGIGDDCPPHLGGLSPISGPAYYYYSCFVPDTLTINIGDSVTFHVYIDVLYTGPHNVVADDGSFRCARGCDGEGGDGTPADSSADWQFTRTFSSPGVVKYHDEVGGASGTIIVRDAAPFAIDGAITGAWYDPAQSGHGLLIEVLSDNRFYATWFAFNPEGTQQSWFTGVGTYSGNTATITNVVLPTGGRWIPNFDPSQVVLNPWGTLTFTFTDCSHGRVDFQSVVTGYGAGSMNLTRLTLPAGLSCS